MVNRWSGGHDGGVSTYGYAKPGTSLSDFYEEDDPIKEVRRQFDEGLVMVPVEPLSVLDVAQAFLQRLGKMSTYKLQKLCFYAQAQHVAWFNTRLFREPVEAWPNGPAVQALYAVHATKRQVERLNEGDAAAVARSPAAENTVRAVAEQYGAWNGDQLKELTHREEPWLAARKGLRAKEPSRQEIPVEVIRDYYRRVTLPLDDEVIEGE